MSRAEEALFAIRNQLGAAKSSLMFNNRWTNEAGYITDAALWIERAISATEEALGAPVNPQDGTAGRQTQPREDQDPPSQSLDRGKE